MTFEEWFEQEYWPIDGEDWNETEEERMVTNMRKAWNASRENLTVEDI